MKGHPTLWKRAGAYIVDCLVVAPFGLAAFWFASREDASFGAVVSVGAAAFCAALLYRVISHAIWGQTIGKRVAGLKVVDHYDRGPITLGQALAREALGSVLVVWESLLVLFAITFQGEG